MEQISFDFGASKKEESSVTLDFESFSDDELHRAYQEVIGIDPKFRALDRERVLAGLRDPKAEKQRIADEDAAADREEMSSPRAGR